MTKDSRLHRLLWILLAILLWGGTARADEIDTFTVTEITTMVNSFPDNTPVPGVIWVIFGPTERSDIPFFANSCGGGPCDYYADVAEIFQLFSINSTGQGPPLFITNYFNCSPPELGTVCYDRYAFAFRTTLPLGDFVTSTVALSDPVATSEPASLALVGTGICLIGLMLFRVTKPGSCGSESAIHLQN